MKPFFIANTLIIVLAACTPQPSPAATTLKPSTPLNATALPTPTIDYKALYGQGVETFAKQYGFDMTCTPYCWQNFVPGQTPMSDIVSFLDKVNIHDLGTLGDPTLPLSVIGFGAGATIYTFADNSQPTKLRALSLQMGLPIRDLGIDLGMDHWLPQNIIKGNLRPLRIFYTIEFDHLYFLLLDFGGWAVEYNGYTVFANSKHQACLYQQLPNIVIWSYSASEHDAWSLIQDLETYPSVASVSSLGPPYGPKDQLKTVNSSPQLDKMIAQLTSNTCLDLN